MMFYQNELLANVKKQEVEEMARHAWKYSTIKPESFFQKSVKFLSENLITKKSGMDSSNCVACQL